MILPLEPTLLIVALLWLPAVAVLGATYTAIAWRFGRRQGSRAVAGVWLATTLLAAAGVLAFARGQSQEWGGRFGAFEAIKILAVVVPLIGACLGAAALVVRRGLTAGVGLTADGLLAGAGAAVGVWVAFAAVAIAAVRLAG